MYPDLLRHAPDARRVLPLSLHSLDHAVRHILLKVLLSQFGQEFADALLCVALVVVLQTAVERRKPRLHYQRRDYRFRVVVCLCKR